jgi:hypothetical protein
MEQKLFTPKSRNCFYEAKKAPLLLHCSKKWFDAKNTTPIWISPETSPKTSEQFFGLLKHCSKKIQRSDFARDVGANFLY